MGLIPGKKFVCSTLLTILFYSAWSQQADTTKPSDTVGSAFVRSMQKLGSEEAVRSIEKFREEQISKKQLQLVNLIARTNHQLNSYLRKGLDTAGIRNELEETRNSLEIIKDGVFINKGTSQTHRNLTVSSDILSELIKRMVAKKNQLDEYRNMLVDFRDKLDSLQADSVLYYFPNDSVRIRKYQTKLSIVVKEILPVESRLSSSLNIVEELQPRVDLMVYDLRVALEDVELYRKELSSQNFNREFSNLWGEVGFSRPLGEILKFSLSKENLLIGFYFNDNQEKLFIILILIVLLTFLIRSIKKRLAEEGALDPEYKNQLVVRYPLLSALVIVLSIFQFIFFDPPFIFSFCFWLISAISLTMIFRNYITPYWMRFWIIFVVLFILASFDNFILQASRTERWMMAVLSMIGMVYGSLILLKRQEHELKEKKILFFIAFVVLLQAGSIIANMFGRFNLSKTYLATGFVGLIIAILFLWTARLINEGFSIASRVYKHPDRNLFFINFEKVGNRVPGFFYVLLVIGWFILIGRNFYTFKLFTGPLYNTITEERTIGDYTFTISGLLIFVLILIASMFLSRLVSFFASEPVAAHEAHESTTKVGIGSWLLLVRIFIISMGLFLALAAAGIPLDKITIIIGALGVGIGLGLQSLVNNLVSGLIIAFEKPVNVGDNIEVNGKPGTMKSIGFRSSVVTLSDGACLIIPNGDLLSQHLVNWSMAKNVKKISTKVGVAYGSDLQQVKSILQNILKADDRIIKYPEPSVVAKEFNHSSIDFELSYWVRNQHESSAVVSNIIEGIDREFKNAGIVIPLPQQELHIRPSK
jgi:small-conductance mechanosensitive channel